MLFGVAFSGALVKPVLLMVNENRLESAQSPDHVLILY
jgi:hypothetical protein